MATNNENNSGLYFIVGALVVAVAIMGFIYMDDSQDIDMQVPASVQQAADDAANGAEETTSELNINIDEDGVSGSSTQSTDN